MVCFASASVAAASARKLVAAVAAAAEFPAVRRSTKVAAKLLAGPHAAVEAVMVPAVAAVAAALREAYLAPAETTAPPVKAVRTPTAHKAVVLVAVVLAVVRSETYFEASVVLVQVPDVARPGFDAASPPHSPQVALETSSDAAPAEPVDSAPSELCVRPATRAAFSEHRPPAKNAFAPPGPDSADLVAVVGLAGIVTSVLLATKFVPNRLLPLAAGFENWIAADAAVAALALDPSAASSALAVATLRAVETPGNVTAPVAVGSVELSSFLASARKSELASLSHCNRKAARADYHCQSEEKTEADWIHWVGHLRNPSA